MSKAVTKKNVASKYRQGSGWIVSTYAPWYKTWQLSHEVGYYEACQCVRQARADWNTKKQQYDR